MALFTLKIFQEMRMSEKCRNKNKSNSGNPLTFHRTDGGKNVWLVKKQINLEEDIGKQNYNIRTTDQYPAHFSHTYTYLLDELKM